MLRLTVVKRELLKNHSKLLPTSNYAAMRANKVLAAAAERVEGKRRGVQSGPKGLKCWAAPEVGTKRAAGAMRLRAEVIGDQGAWDHVMADA